MKFILAANILEHHGFGSFALDASNANPQASFLIAGGLLNVFPEPGENLQASIFHELYGNMIVDGLDELVDTNFKTVANSKLISPLCQMLAPLGGNYEKAKHIARLRYRMMFEKWAAAFGKATLPKMVFIPGNMDYPRIGEQEIHAKPQFHQLDCEIIELDGVKIGGIGGIPNTAHPFRNVTEISPYEMDPAEYKRRLKLLSGADVLLTHVSPLEFPELADFLKTANVKLLICRAPFNFNRKSEFRGRLEVKSVHGKSVITVRPFDYPVNHYYVVDLKPGTLNPPEIKLCRWEAKSHSKTRTETATSSTTSLPPSLRL